MTMRTSVLFALVCASAGPVAAQTPRIEVTTRESRPSQRGPSETFTGSVLVNQLFGVKDGTRATGGHVTFEPGARSAWHTHPAGQTLIVTAGVGLVQEWQGAPRVIKEGDVVWTPPGVKHWHGATATSSLAHIAIQETVDGKNVTWLEHVSDAQYAEAAAAATPRQESTMPTSDDVRAVAPALAGYAATTLEDLWKRPALSPRDRSLVTISALVARQQTADMARQVTRALDNGVTPAELSEAITHLAFYSGWGNAMAAVPIVKEVFAARNVGADQLPAPSPTLLPLDEVSEANRVAQVEKLIGSTSPGLAHYTTDPLFRNVWLRPGLSPRDRSLVTVSALIVNGQVGQLSAHLNRALDNGLTQAQAGEVIAHLAFYAGWPNAFSAAGTAKDVFAARNKAAGQ